MINKFARVLADNPTGTTVDGSMFVVNGGLEWQPVQWLDPWDCEHQETMCAMCVDTWNIDYEIELPTGLED